MTIHADTTLPQIVRFIGRYDSGEFGATNCPQYDAPGHTKVAPS